VSLLSNDYFAEKQSMKKLYIVIYLLVCVTVISFEANAQPINDDPCAAIDLPVGTGSLCVPTNSFSWTGATPTAGVPAPGCGSYLTGDIWFKATVPLSGKLVICTAAGSGPGAITDAAMNVYTATPCTGVFNYITCDDDDGPGNMPQITLGGFLPGTILYIRLWDFYDATSGNIGGICVTDPSPPIDLAGKRIGIDISNPDAKLDINGDIMIRGGLPGTGKVLSSDANGLSSWQPLPSVNTGFNANFSAGQAVTLPCLGCLGVLTVNWAIEDFDDGGSLSGTIFTAPATGVYHFDVQIAFSLSGISTAGLDPDYVGLKLNLPGGKEKYSYTSVSPSNNGGKATAFMSCNLKLTSGQTITVDAINATNTTQTIIPIAGLSTRETSYFSGYRVY
jgi:hypothetical protein